MVKNRRAPAGALDKAIAVGSAPVPRRIDPTTDVTLVSITQIRRPNLYRLWITCLSPCCFQWQKNGRQKDEGGERWPRSSRRGGV